VLIDLGSRKIWTTEGLAKRKLTETSRRILNELLLLENEGGDSRLTVEQACPYEGDSEAVIIRARNNAYSAVRRLKDLLKEVKVADAIEGTVGEGWRLNARFELLPPGVASATPAQRAERLLLSWHSRWGDPGVVAAKVLALGDGQGLTRRGLAALLQIAGLAHDPVGSIADADALREELGVASSAIRAAMSPDEIDDLRSSYVTWLLHSWHSRWGNPGVVAAKVLALRDGQSSLTDPRLADLLHVVGLAPDQVGSIADADADAMRDKLGVASSAIMADMSPVEIEDLLSFYVTWLVFGQWPDVEWILEAVGFLEHWSETSLANCDRLLRLTAVGPNPGRLVWVAKELAGRDLEDGGRRVTVAVSCLERAAEAGLAEAHRELAWWYVEGHCGDPTDGITILTGLASGGDRMAAFILAIALLGLGGVEHDEEQGCAWLDRIVENPAPDTVGDLASVVRLAIEMARTNRKLDPSEEHRCRKAESRLEDLDAGELYWAEPLVRNLLVAVALGGGASEAWRRAVTRDLDRWRKFPGVAVLLGMRALIGQSIAFAEQPSPWRDSQAPLTQACWSLMSRTTLPGVDREDGERWLREAADGGDLIAKGELGLLLSPTTLGMVRLLPPDPIRARGYLEASLELDVPIHASALGDVLLRSERLDERARGLQLLLTGAAKGEPLAALILARRLASGIGVPVNTSEALRLFEVASKAGIVAAKLDRSVYVARMDLSEQTPERLLENLEGLDDLIERGLLAALLPLSELMYPLSGKAKVEWEERLERRVKSIEAMIAEWPANSPEALLLRAVVIGGRTGALANASEEDRWLDSLLDEGAIWPIWWSSDRDDPVGVARFQQLPHPDSPWSPPAEKSLLEE